MSFLIISIITSHFDFLFISLSLSLSEVLALVKKDKHWSLSISKWKIHLRLNSLLYFSGSHIKLKGDNYFIYQQVAFNSIQTLSHQNSHSQLYAWGMYNLLCILGSMKMSLKFAVIINCSNCDGGNDNWNAQLFVHVSSLKMACGLTRLVVMRRGLPSQLEIGLRLALLYMQVQFCI